MLRRWRVAGRGLFSAAVGYLVLILSAALAFWSMLAAGAVSEHDFLSNPEVHRIAHPESTSLLVSACGAVAGMVIPAAVHRWTPMV